MARTSGPIAVLRLLLLRATIICTVAFSTIGLAEMEPINGTIANKLGLAPGLWLEFDNGSDLYKPFPAITATDGADGSVTRVYLEIAEDKAKFFCKTEERVGDFFNAKKSKNWCRQLVRQVDSFIGCKREYRSACCDGKHCDCSDKSNCKCVDYEIPPGDYLEQSLLWC